MNKKMIFLVILNIFLLSAIKLPITANDNTEKIELCKGSKSCILMEVNSKNILYEKEMNKRLPPASMTKIMTLFLIYDALENNIINKSTILTITEESTKVEGSKAFLSVGENISVDELLKCICIASANDAAIALAIYLEGSEEAFVKKMNSKVKELNLNNTNFSDCTGLSSKNHYTTAYDLAIISRELVSKYPDVLNYTNIKEDYIRKDSNNPFWLVNTNKIIGRVKNLDGLKTGYTSFSKYCITLHMKQNNMELISIVFGYDKSTTRNIEALELLRWGYANYKIDKVLEKNKEIASIDHILYNNSIKIIVKEDFYYLTKKNDNINYEIKYDYKIENNECIGKAMIYYNDNLIGTSDLKSSEEIKRRNFLELWGIIFKKLFI